MKIILIIKDTKEMLLILIAGRGKGVIIMYICLVILKYQTYVFEKYDVIIIL